jgi:putative DNA primase/helicase
VTDNAAKDRLAESRRFITDLWSISDKSWIVEFDFLQYRPTQEDPDAKRMTATFHTVEQVIRDWDLIYSDLEKRNRTQVENIHHGVNPRFQMPKKHGKNSDVSHYVAAWVDVDFGGAEPGVRKAFEIAVDELVKLGLEPSYIIESGHGMHAYWLFDIPYPVADARPIVCGLQDHFKIADAVHDPRRVLRMPGFINLKNPKDPAWCNVTAKTDKRYSVLDFADFAISPGDGQEEREEAELKKGTPRTVSRDPKLEEAKEKGVSEGGGGYGGRHNAAVAVAGHYAAKLNAKKLVFYVMKEWNQKNSPPLSEEELDQIVEDIWAKEQIKRAERGKPEKEKSSKDKAKEKRQGSPWFDEEGNFNAPIMAQWFRREYHFLATPVAENGEGVTLYKYDNGVYTPKGASFVRSETQRHLGALSSKERLGEVIHMLTEYVKTEYAEINKSALDMINVKNGMLEWRTGKLLPHDPAYRSLIQIAADYDPQAKSPDLDNFFDQIFPVDSLPLIDETMGHLMIPSTSLQKAFVAIGSGGNGKGTWLKILTHLLGTENVCSMSLHQIQEDKFAAAGLLGKLANVYHDLDPRVLQSTGKFKSIVSGDPISAERKYKDHYSFTPFARLVFSANEFPRSTDKTEAYFDRLIFVEFPRKFRNTDAQILDYDQVLIQKPKFMSALLNRAVAGLQRLMQNKRFTIPESSQKAIDEYKRECSTALDFIVEYCKKTARGVSKIPRKELYMRYSGWCEEQGMKPLSSKNFAKAARDFGGIDGKIMGIRIWDGLDWLEGSPPANEVLDFQASAGSSGDSGDGGSGRRTTHEDGFGSEF